MAQNKNLNPGILAADDLLYKLAKFSSSSEIQNVSVLHVIEMYEQTSINLTESFEKDVLPKLVETAIKSIKSYPDLKEKIKNQVES